MQLTVQQLILPRKCWKGQGKLSLLFSFTKKFKVLGLILFREDITKAGLDMPYQEEIKKVWINSSMHLDQFFIFSCLNSKFDIPHASILLLQKSLKQI